MDDPSRHENKKYNFWIPSKLPKIQKTSILYDVRINSGAEFYKDYLNYESNYDNKLLNSNTSLMKYFEVDKYRKRFFIGA